jgi:hypothetical protein
MSVKEMFLILTQEPLLVLLLLFLQNYMYTHVCVHSLLKNYKYIKAQRK